MKRILLFFLMLLSSFVSISADDDAGSSREHGLHGTAICSKSVTGKPKHVPPVCDLLLIINEQSVEILFNGSFGPGRYNFRNLTSEYSVVGTVDSDITSVVSIPYTVPINAVIEFSIEFEDGSWCHLTWNP